MTTLTAKPRMGGLRRELVAARALMVLGGLAIALGDQIGWFSGMRVSVTGPVFGHFSPEYAMRKWEWYATIWAPCFALVFVPRQGFLLRAASLVSGLVIFPVIGAFVTHLPHAFPSGYIAHARYTGLYVSIGGLLVGWTGAGWAVDLSKDLVRASTKTCPACAEKVKREAIVCKHCGTKLE